MINFIHHQQWQTNENYTIEKKSIHCTAAQKITTYYNIYKTDSPHSYTEIVHT